jgi:DNA polymerase I-like protein with 3'-5' exonuclease and polymerase domains
MWMMAVTHPAASFRNPMTLGPLMAHVENFIHCAVNGPPPRPRLERNPSAKRFKEFLRTARREKLAINIDVETGRYGHIAAFAELKIIGVGIDYGTGWGLSWDYSKMPYAVRQLLKKVLRSRKYVKCGMNLDGYDRPVLRRYGFVLRGKVEDIRDGRRALSATSKLALDHQAAIYIPGCPPWKTFVREDDDGNVKGSYFVGKNVTDDDLDYNAEDAVRTAQIRRRHLPELREGGPRVQRIYQQLRRLSRVAGEMMENGCPFDRGEQVRLDIQLKNIFRREASAFKKLVEKRAPYFRFDGTGTNKEDLKALLFRECSKPGIKSFNLEVPLSEKCWTDSGQPSVDRDALLYLFAQPDTPDEVRHILRSSWKVNAPLKVRSTYVRSKRVEDAIGPDGRVHPSINSCAAETYRWTCSRPNLFNLSKEVLEEDENLRGVLPNPRALYHAPRGYVLVSRDFKALELEVMAEYTGDAALRRMLDLDKPTDRKCKVTGKPLKMDVHSQTVRLWFHKPEDENPPSQIRVQAKKVRFSSGYAAGCEQVYMKVLEQIQDAVWEEIHAMWTMFQETHTGITQHWEASMQEATQYGYNEAPIMGYRRTYPPGSQIKPTETSNYAIQAGAAAIANCTLVGFGDEESYKRSLHYRLRKEFPDAYMFMHVYDSFDVACPEKDAAGVNALVEECMRGPWEIGSRPKLYASDGKIGYRWSEV